MGSYFIFALVLTVLYIVYFAVNIIRDLYGKKGTEKTDEEVFDLGPMDSTEESVEVSENETGFKIGNETYGTETVPAASPAAQNGDTGKKDGTAKDRLERLKAKAEAQMEKVAPYLSDGFTDEEVFDLGPMDATEESVEVSENETGFSIGNETCDTEAVAAPPAVQDGDTGKKEAAAKERLERLKAKAEAQMEEIAPYLSDGFTDEEMYKALISKGRLDNRPCLKWRPVKDKL